MCRKQVDARLKVAVISSTGERKCFPSEQRLRLAAVLMCRDQSRWLLHGLKRKTSHVHCVRVDFGRGVGGFEVCGRVDLIFDPSVDHFCGHFPDTASRDRTPGLKRFESTRKGRALGLGLFLLLDRYDY
jgi:hypothetical protein